MNLSSYFPGRYINFVEVSMTNFDLENYKWIIECSVDKQKHNIIFFPDFVTFSNNKCNEIEYFINQELEQYCTFIVPNYGVDKIYKDLSVVYYNKVLRDNSWSLDRNKDFILKNLNPIAYKKWLCLNRIEKDHRNAVLKLLIPYYGFGIISNQQVGIEDRKSVV